MRMCFKSKQNADNFQNMINMENSNDVQKTTNAGNEVLADVSTSYLILSGEGNIDTKHQFCMELTTLEEANFHFNNFKRGQFKDTYLFIYEAKKIREE